jgi:hypothetical protein
LSSRARAAKLRGHIHDGFVGGGQALGDAAAESRGAFDRPLPLRPLPGPGPQPGDGVAVDLEPDRGTDLAARLQGDRGEGALMGSIPMVITGYLLSRVMSPATGNLT